MTRRTSCQHSQRLRWYTGNYFTLEKVKNLQKSFKNEIWYFRKLSVCVVVDLKTSHRFWRNNQATKSFWLCLHIQEQYCNLKTWKSPYVKKNLSVRKVVTTQTPDFRTLWSNIFAKMKNLAKPFQPVHMGSRRIFYDPKFSKISWNCLFYVWHTAPICLFLSYAFSFHKV